MARPYWSGNVQISLVSFGVSLYTATESKNQISFHQISRSTGERIRHQKVLESAVESSEAAPSVTKDEIVKGYEYAKGQYVLVEQNELDNLRVPSKHTIEVSQFVNLAELSPAYIEKPYYVTPQNDMQVEAFAVVRQALLKTGKAAIGKVAFSGRESIVALTPAGGPDDRGMLAYTLRYANELRNQADYFRDIKAVAIPEDSLEMAEALIQRKTAKFDISKFEDGYETALRELIDAKIKHAPVPVEAEAPKAQPGKIINLMDALRKSLGTESAPAQPAAAQPAARAGKKPPVSVKEVPAAQPLSGKAAGAKPMGLVKPKEKPAPRRKSA
jgi:DNA end-binding protein Ku